MSGHAAMIRIAGIITRVDIAARGHGAFDVNFMLETELQTKYEIEADVTQDATCLHDAVGTRVTIDIDRSTGTFWIDEPFDVISGLVRTVTYYGQGMTPVGRQPWYGAGPSTHIEHAEIDGFAPPNRREETDDDDEH